MSKLNHRYFGDIDTSVTSTDVIWEREVTLNSAVFEVSLWVSPNEQIDRSALDAFAVLLEDLQTLDAGARRSLQNYLGEDRSFIEYHAEELQDSDVISRLISDTGHTEIEIDAFVSAMQLKRIGLWLGVKSSPVVMDYMVDPDNSDQILAVKTSRNGDVVSVDWES
jgi:hypothetical protein